MLVFFVGGLARTSSRRRTACASVAPWVLALFLGTSPSFAESAANRAAAQTLSEQGLAALKLKHFEVAEDRLRRADELAHAPTIVVAHGRALMGLGRYVEAQERFELVLREGVDALAPETWKYAVEEATTLLERVRPKIAWLAVNVPTVRDPRVTVDGELVPLAAIGVRRAVDPGSRTIEVTADEYKARTMTVQLGEGDQRSVQIVLGKLRAPKEDAAAEDPMPARARDMPRVELRQGSRSTWTYVALGVGGVGLAAGSITGFLALQKRSDLDQVCGGGVCPRSVESDLSAYNTLGYVSGISFAVGGAGTVTGVVGLLSGPDRAPSENAAVRIDVGPAHVGLQGVF